MLRRTVFIPGESEASLTDFHRAGRRTPFVFLMKTHFSCDFDNERARTFITGAAR